MLKLVSGIHAFQSQMQQSQRQLFRKLSAGQSPETLFISCSDSRVVPDLFTSARPGELFVLRNAGNLVPPAGVGGGEEATIEYAVEVLGVRDVVICGHTDCGAMKALVNPALAERAPAVRAWLRHAAETRRILDETYPDVAGDARVTLAVEENVLVQLENLRTLPSVAARVADGSLRLHGWVFKIATGEVFAYDQASSQYIPVQEALAAAGRMSSAPPPPVVEAGG
jgi:carbonic anhydrase